MFLSSGCCTVSETLIAPIFTGHVPIVVLSDRAVWFLFGLKQIHSGEGIVRVKDEGEQTQLETKQKETKPAVKQGEISLHNIL